MNKDLSNAPDYVKEINTVRAQLLEGINQEMIDRCSDIDKYYEDDEMAKDVLRKKYLSSWEKSPLDMWIRVAWGAAQAEKEDDRIYWAKTFLNILMDYYFIPGGRINYGLGRSDVTVSFSNCYVIPIKEDSLEGIYTCLKEEAMTYKFGGGCGHDISVLRPENATIKGTGGKSCGAIGFMEIFSASTNTVAQNNRRGANLQTLIVSHPDIEKFVDIKNDIEDAVNALKKIARELPKNSKELNIIKQAIERKRSVQYSNISVKITDEFMRCVEKDADFNLQWGGKIYKTIKAKDLWNKIIKNAHSSAEPGIVFWDRIVENSNLEYKNPVICLNPCGEINMGAYGNCLLGHINLTKFVKTKNDKPYFDYDNFKYYIKTAMRFLDDVITLGYGKHPLKEQNEMSINERRTGLGISGLGDMFVLMGLRYGSEQSIEFINKVMEVFRDTAYDASCDLSEEKGSFPWFDAEKWFCSKFTQKLPEQLKLRIWEKGIRNGVLLTVAPCGTGSIIGQISSGIEPIFRKSFTRKIKNSDNVSYTEYKVYHPLIKKLFGEENIPSYVVDSTQIKPDERIKIQATVQKYIDNSISSTINLPETATTDDVENIYMTAWKLGCKGCTVYVEGSREGILISDEIKPQQIKLQKGERLVPKRSPVLEGETYKVKIDLTGKRPYSTYVTVNFKPGTKIPIELLVTETNSNKEFKDIVALEATSRLVSLALRHGIPVEFIISQLDRVNCQYIYSLPVSIANILRNYIDVEDIDDEDFVGEKCPACGESTIKRENGCASCINPKCAYSKCS